MKSNMIALNESNENQLFLHIVPYHEVLLVY